MVLVKTLPRPNERLDLTHLHDAIHSLVLSRREGVGFWSSAFESAWAGFIIAGHTPSNKDETTVNLIKGELLGDKRPTKFDIPVELAAAYMSAAFFQRVGLSDVAVEFINMANAKATSISCTIDLDERFHLFSAPEYLYSIALAHTTANQVMPDSVTNAIVSSLAEIRNAQWRHSGYVFALAAASWLMMTKHSQNACTDVCAWLARQVSSSESGEHIIPLVWFLENHWDRIRSGFGEDERERFDALSIDLRSELLRTVDRLDVQGVWCPTTEDGYENLVETPSWQGVTTIELLMLDEIAEKHSRSIVVTPEELDEHRLLTSVFEKYKLRVDEKLTDIGLDRHLDAVYDELTQSNPASWQQAVLTCRNIFYALSASLWQVPGDTYEIPGEGRIEVTPGHERNRLTAYLHCSGVSKKKHPVVRAEFEAVCEFMHEFVNRTAKAKHTVTYDEALSLFMAMYVLLHEMIVLTNLVPITSTDPVT